jgi:hypothetical protein
MPRRDQVKLSESASVVLSFFLNFLCMSLDVDIGLQVDGGDDDDYGVSHIIKDYSISSSIFCSIHAFFVYGLVTFDRCSSILWFRARHQRSQARVGILWMKMLCCFSFFVCVESGLFLFLLYWLCCLCVTYFLSLSDRVMRFLMSSLSISSLLAVSPGHRFTVCSRLFLTFASMSILCFFPCFLWMMEPCICSLLSTASFEQEKNLPVPQSKLQQDLQEPRWAQVPCDDWGLCWDRGVYVGWGLVFHSLRDWNSFFYKMSKREREEARGKIKRYQRFWVTLKS